MRFLILAKKDLLLLFRDKMSFIFLLLMPVAFTVFMGIAFGSGVGDDDPRLVLGWVNQNPNGLACKTLYQFLSQSEVVKLVDLDPAVSSSELSDRVRNGKLAAALIIPPDYNKSIMSGKVVPITLIVDDLSTNGQEVIQTVRAALTRLSSSVKIADLVVDSLGSNDPVLHTTIFEEASAAWKKTAQNNLGYQVEKAVGQPSISQVISENPFKHTSPGILVQFAVFGLVTSAGVLVDERKTGTLQRLMTTSMSRAEIIAGHVVSMFTIGLLQSIILALFGQLFLHVDYLRQPLAILLVLAALSLWVSSLGLFIGVFAKDDGQVVLFSLIAMFLFAALGGAWFPIETVGESFVLAARLTPSYYAIQGLENILVRELGLSSVLTPVLLLMLFAGLFFAAAVWRFSKSQQK